MYCYQFLLKIILEILNGWIGGVTVSKDVALFVYGIFNKSIGVLEHAVRGKSGLPGESAAMQWMFLATRLLYWRTYVLMIVWEATQRMQTMLSMCYCHMISELLLILLVDLKPPTIIRKWIKQSDNQDGASCSSKPWPYKEFMRDIVALIGSCVYRRKHAQDEIMRRNGILLLLQQCFTREDNHFLREKRIKSLLLS